MTESQFVFGGRHEPKMREPRYGERKLPLGCTCDPLAPSLVDVYGDGTVWGHVRLQDCPVHPRTEV